MALIVRPPFKRQASRPICLDDMGQTAMRTRRFRYVLEQIWSAVLICGAFSLLPAAPALASRAAEALNVGSLSGEWSTQDGNGVIDIERCGDALCGRIVGIARPPGTPIPRDVRGISQCGLTILTNEKPTGDGAWLGEITDPRDGTTYGAKIWLDRSGNLRVRGFLGIPLLGQTQTWHRFTGRLTTACDVG
jgi:uncharacterized protein (DUF2147 family)